MTNAKRDLKHRVDKAIDECLIHNDDAFSVFVQIIVRNRSDEPIQKFYTWTDRKYKESLPKRKLKDYLD